MRFFTENNVDVTQRVKNGETAVFTNVIEAEKYAAQQRSYMYPVFCQLPECTKRNQYGYAVPK